MQLYMDYVNATYTDNEDSFNQILQLATQVHLSYISCNNASTEHLSILHLCYDVSTNLRARAMKGNNADVTNRAMSQVRFWTEQLKMCHMVRYGELGGDLENVRQVMKHSKLVLRNPEGWYLAKDQYI